MIPFLFAAFMLCYTQDDANAEGMYRRPSAALIVLKLTLYINLDNLLQTVVFLMIKSIFLLWRIYSKRHEMIFLLNVLKC